MSTTLLISLLGAAAWLPGLWGVLEALKKRRMRKVQVADEGDRLVVKSALELLTPYQARVHELEGKMRTTTEQVDTLSKQLAAANRQVLDLTAQLSDAHTEVGYLRLQIKTMAQQLPDGPR